MPVPLEQTSYDIAYFVLPKYGNGTIDHFSALRARCGDTLGPFFYIMACQMRKVEPSVEDARRYRWHHGVLPGGRAYHVLEFPTPAPRADTTVESMMEQLKGGVRPPVLAPHFAGIIVALDGTPSYYVLGQNPIGGGTTLRSVTVNEGGYQNANLGPGPEPDLAEFVGTIAGR
jgi:hypothetical protein